jgi:hypothetical protein
MKTVNWGFAVGLGLMSAALTSETWKGIALVFGAVLVLRSCGLPKETKP